jgi:hypothetical protein
MAVVEEVTRKSDWERRLWTRSRLWGLVNLKLLGFALLALLEVMVLEARREEGGGEGVRQPMFPLASMATFTTMVGGAKGVARDEVGDGRDMKEKKVARRRRTTVGRGGVCMVMGK